MLLCSRKTYRLDFAFAINSASNSAACITLRSSHVEIIDLLGGDGASICIDEFGTEGH